MTKSKKDINVSKEAFLDSPKTLIDSVGFIFKTSKEGYAFLDGKQSSERLSEKQLKKQFQSKLKAALLEKTHCAIQHNGWTCGTCFFTISKKFTNSDWQNALLIRGDTKESELNNLPSDRVASYEKILAECAK